MRGCSRNFLGANALCPELSLSLAEVLMIVSPSRHVSKRQQAFERLDVLKRN
jgi:hypothetical protein